MTSLTRSAAGESQEEGRERIDPEVDCGEFTGQTLAPRGVVSWGELWP
jgi:hypothetical protein